MRFFKPKHPALAARERRLDQRKPSELQAAICWEQDQSLQCRITSISLTGLFLELQEAQLASGAIMQLFFYGTMDGSQKLCSEWVRVEGTRHNGVAVSFTRFDNQHQCNMQLMLHQAMVPPAPLTKKTGASPLPITQTA